MNGWFIVKFTVGQWAKNKHTKPKKHQQTTPPPKKNKQKR